MQAPIRLGRVLGFPVRLSWSAVAVFALILWALATVWLPAALPGRDPALYWRLALVMGVLLFASLLAHELGHAVAARRRGMEVTGITVWLLGGLADLRGEAPTPRAEFRVAAAGPAVSLALALGCGVTTAVLATAGAPAAVVGPAAWLAFANALIAVFNLLPGAPLDGGRILRAVLWRRHGDRLRAALTAARAGRLLGVALAGLGTAEIVLTQRVGAVWLILIGWFMFVAAQLELGHATVRSALRGVTVGAAMSPPPLVGPDWLTVDAFLERHPGPQGASVAVLRSFGGDPAGMVTAAQLAGVPPGRRAATRVAAVATGPDQVVTATPGEELAAVLGRLGERGQDHALVVDDGEVVGVVTPGDAARAVGLGLEPGRHRGAA
jgi:Zn-dependent protease